MPKNRTIMNEQFMAGVPERLLAHGLNVNSLRHNAVLQKEEWLQFDTVVIEEAMIRLTAFADLLAAGLSFDINNAMGTTVLEWEDMSDMQPAVRSMDGVTRDRSDRVEFSPNSIPLHITHKDFFLNLRHLEASRRLGQSLDLTQARVCSRLVSESLEDALFNGTGLTWDANQV